MVRAFIIFWFNVFSLLFLLHLNAQAETSLRVDAEQLNQSFKNGNLVVLDARSAKAYHQSHLPGALNFPESETYLDKAQNGRIASPHFIQKKVRSLGLDKEDEIVIYDEGDLMAAARLFWTLEVYGFVNIKVLNQGIEGWKSRNFPISNNIYPIKPSSYIASINHNRLATKFKMQIASKLPTQVIIDARSNLAYIGKKSTAKRFGHIPTAINIPATHNLEGSNKLKSLQPLNELQKLYSGIPKDSKVVLYCAIGRISTTNYLVLRELGYDVSNYDASWKEWGNDFSLPVEK